MPSTFTSPYAASFRTACNKGVSYNAAVENIAKRWKTTTNQVWSSLYKAGCCNRQKFNGQWIYFPTNFKASSRNAKNAQYEAWQWFCEWCLSSGNCTTTKFAKNYGSQSAFAKAFANYWTKQFSSNGSNGRKTTSNGRKTTTSNGRTSTTTKGRKTSTTSGRKTTASKRTTSKRTTTGTTTNGRKSTTSRSRTTRTGTKTGGYRFANYTGSKRKAA